MSSATATKPKAKKEAFNSETIEPQHPDDFSFAYDDLTTELPPDIIVCEEELKKKQADDIAFGEEPVMIRLAEATEEFGAESIPCWNQGKGAEIFDPPTRRWYVVTGIQRGVPVITRRKYAEIIIRSKIMEVRTKIIQSPGKDPVNDWTRRTVQKYPYEILRDNSPRAQQWRESMARLRA